MKKYLLLTLILLGALVAYAQPERVGQSGATELLINNVPRSSALNGLNIGDSDGIESSFVNPAGVGSTEGTELLFSHTRWLIGSDIRINCFGVSQQLGDDRGTLGLAINAFNFGDIPRTTAAVPDGSLGTFRVTYLNLGLTYAKRFGKRIYVGTTVRVISESTPEVASTGVAFDAGVQYRTGKKDRLKLGIALRNVGPTMNFDGDGLTRRVLINTNNDFTSTLALQGENFELPAMLSMGASLDFFLGNSNTVTANAGFISNSFYYNQGGLGLSYKYKEYVILRASFLYENGIFGETIGIDGRYNAFTGLGTGATFQVPFKSGRRDLEGKEIYSKFSLDMSYRTTNPFGGTLVLGVRVDI
ncbi:MAG: PorV/PorQ family protein [Bacteroidia bacterium]|nr:PorV/PorQ family protein [Bacteroidia bacterium]